MFDPTKEEVKAVLDELEDYDLPDGAYWAMAHDRLGLEYGDIFDFIADDPEFFDYCAPGEEQAP